MPQNPTLPPKWPRSGVTFHSKKFYVSLYARLSLVENICFCLKTIIYLIELYAEVKRTLDHCYKGKIRSGKY